MRKNDITVGTSYRVQSHSPSPIDLHGRQAVVVKAVPNATMERYPQRPTDKQVRENPEQYVQVDVPFGRGTIVVRKYHANGNDYGFNPAGWLVAYVNDEGKATGSYCVVASRNICEKWSDFVPRKEQHEQAVREYSEQRERAKADRAARNARDLDRLAAAGVPVDALFSVWERRGLREGNAYANDKLDTAVTVLDAVLANTKGE